MVKMNDVAVHAGVSVATVSNVLTGKRNVSPEVTARVMKAIEELDYHVNLMARGLKTQRTNTIGVILPDMTKLFFNDVLKGIIIAANDAGYNINVLTTDFEIEKERKHVSLMRAHGYDAIILDSCIDYHESYDWASEIVGSGDQAIPVVSLENPMDPELVSSVSVDYFHSSYAATEHLIELGRKKIFYISGPAHLYHEKERLAGYKSALKDHDIKTNPNLIRSRDYLSGSVYDDVHGMLGSRCIFDAIQASNDMAAIGALKALKEAGRKVPGDVALCGFDDLFPTSLVSPSITTVSVPKFDIGYEAVLECIRRINDPDATPKKIVMDSSLVIRESTVPDHHTEWNLHNW